MSPRDRDLLVAGRRRGYDRMQDIASVRQGIPGVQVDLVAAVCVAPAIAEVVAEAVAEDEQAMRVCP